MSTTISLQPISSLWQLCARHSCTLRALRALLIRLSTCWSAARCRCAAGLLLCSTASEGSGMVAAPCAANEPTTTVFAESVGNVCKGAENSAIQPGRLTATVYKCHGVPIGLSLLPPSMGLPNAGLYISSVATALPTMLTDQSSAGVLGRQSTGDSAAAAAEAAASAASQQQADTGLPAS